MPVVSVWNDDRGVTEVLPEMLSVSLAPDPRLEPAPRTRRYDMVLVVLNRPPLARPAMGCEMLLDRESGCCCCCCCICLAKHEPTLEMP